MRSGLGCRRDAGDPFAGEASQLGHVRRALVGGAAFNKEGAQLGVGLIEGLLQPGPLLGGGLNPLVQLIHVAHSDTTPWARATRTRIGVANGDRERYSHSHAVRSELTAHQSDGSRTGTPAADTARRAGGREPKAARASSDAQPAPQARPGRSGRGAS